MERITVLKSTFFVLILLFIINGGIVAQDKVEEEKKLSDKFFFGGSIGLMFGNETRIDILPEAGIWVIPNWAVGLGGRYTFLKKRFNVFNGESNPYQTHIWGLSGFTQILPFPDLDKAFKIGIHGGPVFHGEWEGLYLDKGVLNPTVADVEGMGWVHIFLIGGGYRFPAGKKAALNLLVLWELTNSRYSPYTSNPLIRISVNF